MAGMRAQVLTSWQTHGAKLEAVRAEFQTDAQSIRDILRLWQRHGHQINAYLESSEANTLQNGAKGLPDVKSNKVNGVDYLLHPPTPLFPEFMSSLHFSIRALECNLPTAVKPHLQSLPAKSTSERTRVARVHSCACI